MVVEGDGDNNPCNKTNVTIVQQPSRDVVMNSADSLQISDNDGNKDGNKDGDSDNDNDDDKDSDDGSGDHIDEDEDDYGYASL
jgi:hypothetical protein